VLLLVTGKGLVVLLVAFAARNSFDIALRTAAQLAQAGEFGLVLTGLASELKLIGDDVFQVTLSAMLVSMFVAPFLIERVARLSGQMARGDWAHKAASVHEVAVAGFGLDQHVIICGFGRTGSMLARELHAGKSTIVVIEPDHDRYVEAKALGYLCLHADATEESVLKKAGISRARALASVVSSDPVNVFITLSARSLNTGIQIIARGEAPSTEKKLLQAGANAVVLPAHIGAEQIASMILFPAIANVIQGAERRRQMETDMRALGLEVEVAIVAEGSAFAGRTVDEIERRAERTFFIIAIEKAGSGIIDRPDPDTRIYPGDGVTILGRGGRADAMECFDAPVATL
jgi:Trk K+ transport system NAD-binding subunit